MRFNTIRIGLVLLGFLLLSCSGKIYRTAYPSLTDGKYDTEFPYRSASKELKQIVESVKMINCISYYKAYRFEAADSVLASDVPKLLDSDLKPTDFFSSTASGTATVIYYRKRRIALLTCAHILDFPDTITYFHPAGGSSGNLVETVAIKDRQNNYVVDFEEGNELQILAMDPDLDLAVLGKRFEFETERPVGVFRYPLGRAKELEWGSFVYLVGFPVGYKMITKGIVSSPNRNKSGAFLVDAVFNRGFSGGVVLAVRDGVPNFEWVGLAISVPVSFEISVTPEKGLQLDSYDMRVPFRGELYLERRGVIRYGITHAISMESIRSFFKERKDEFLEEGYDFETFQ